MIRLLHAAYTASATHRESSRVNIVSKRLIMDRVMPMVEITLSAVSSGTDPTCLAPMSYKHRARMLETLLVLLQ